MRKSFSNHSVLIFILMILVILAGTAVGDDAFCQSAQQSPGSGCSMKGEIDKALTKNWTIDQKQVLKNAVVPMIQKRVSEHWSLSKVDLFGIPSATLCVQFKLEANGEITEAKITQSSHSALLDQLAFKAVEAASPLDPLPAELPIKSLTVSYRFTYELEHTTFSNMPFAPLSQLPNSFKESRTHDHDFAVVVSVHPSFTEPLATLKDCCLETWAEAVQNEWATLAASSKGKSLVEIQAYVEPDGTVDKLSISTPSGDGRVDRAAMKSISDFKLAMKVSISEPVKIRVDFLANETPDDALTATTF